MTDEADPLDLPRTPLDDDDLQTVVVGVVVTVLHITMPVTVDVNEVRFEQLASVLEQLSEPSWRGPKAISSWTVGLKRNEQDVKWGSSLHRTLSITNALYVTLNSTPGTGDLPATGC